ncbi:hypothetical protein KY314_01685 [Candidatus Woesearchaeota archaeon]|nr:hypothetical protein [Candidatus Woesearchaeota archaeon]
MEEKIYEFKIKGLAIVKAKNKEEAKEMIEEVLEYPNEAVNNEAIILDDIIQSLEVEKFSKILKN